MTDAGLVAATTQRLFKFRAEHQWPPRLRVSDGWEPLYADAAEGLDVLPTAAEAATWLNAYIAGLASNNGQTD